MSKHRVIKLTDPNKNVDFIVTDGTKVWAFNEHKVPMSLSNYAYAVPGLNGTMEQNAYVKGLILTNYSKPDMAKEVAKGLHMNRTKIIEVSTFDLPAGTRPAIQDAIEFKKNQKVNHIEHGNGVFLGYVTTTQGRMALVKYKTTLNDLGTLTNPAELEPMSATADLKDLESKNHDWGFYGSIKRSFSLDDTTASELFDAAVEALSDTSGELEYKCRDYLDSKHGRILSDELTHWMKSDTPFEEMVKMVKDHMEETVRLGEGRFEDFMRTWNAADYDHYEMEDFANTSEADLIPGGKADDKSPDDFDQEQLLKGIQIELEHTKSVMLAMEIAMDHLSEFPNYYTRLEKMESTASEGPSPDDGSDSPRAGDRITYSGNEFEVKGYRGGIVRLTLKKALRPEFLSTDSKKGELEISVDSPQWKRAVENWLQKMSTSSHLFTSRKDILADSEDADTYGVEEGSVLSPKGTMGDLTQVHDVYVVTDANQIEHFYNNMDEVKEDWDLV